MLLHMKSLSCCSTVLLCQVQTHQWERVYAHTQDIQLSRWRLHLQEEKIVCVWEGEGGENAREWTEAIWRGKKESERARGRGKTSKGFLNSCREFWNPRHCDFLLLCKALHSTVNNARHGGEEISVAQSHTNTLGVWNNIELSGFPEIGWFSHACVQTHAVQ